jgi:tRNA(Arg) A34 adenosine deaminase TadA
MRHGAIVVKSGNIIARATNRFRNDPKVIVDDFAQTTHAEVAGLRAVRNPRGCVVYVARWSFHDCPVLSAPCDRCFNYMASLGVRKVIYTEGYHP